MTIGAVAKATSLGGSQLGHVGRPQTIPPTQTSNPNTGGSTLTYGGK